MIFWGRHFVSKKSQFSGFLCPGLIGFEVLMLSSNGSFSSFMGARGDPEGTNYLTQVRVVDAVAASPDRHKNSFSSL